MAAVPDWFEPRLPSAEECSIGRRLAERAEHEPEGDLALFDTGERWTNADAFHQAEQFAAKLQGLGVGNGDMVAVWQPNGPNVLRAIFACSMLGATACLINVAFRGNMLSRALAVGGAQVLFAHGALVERLEDVDLGPVTTIVAAEPCALGRRDVRLLPEAALSIGLSLLPALRQPWDLAAIVFTSGTTGASKGVRVTCCQLWSLGNAFYGFMTAADRMLLMLPLFHIGALGALHGAIARQASLAVMEAFRPTDFWDVVRRTGATTNVGAGHALISLLLKSPPGPDDREHSLRRMLVTSSNAEVREFSRRFGCEVYAGYSMSETSGIAISEVNPAKDRSVGRVRKGLEARLVDANDVEAPLGQAGELIVRSAIPWVLNDGYHNDPQATVAAWRNGWFHTGDVFVQDDEGDLFFVDRNKDVIRRRGENISSMELEAEIRAHPDVRDAAAIAVAAPEGDEVLAVVEPLPGRDVDVFALTAYLVERLPHYMVPRFIRLMAPLPRTETNKVQKAPLRAEGLTADCWDREVAGIKVRRQRFS